MKLKFWKDLLYEAGTWSQKRIIAWCLGSLTVLDAILLMIKSWLLTKEITTVDITFFGALFAGFCTLIGVAMINKMDMFNKSNNPPEDESR